MHIGLCAAVPEYGQPAQCVAQPWPALKRSTKRCKSAGDTHTVAAVGSRHCEKCTESTKTNRTDSRGENSKTRFRYNISIKTKLMSARLSEIICYSYLLINDRYLENQFLLWLQWLRSGGLSALREDICVCWLPSKAIAANATLLAGSTIIMALPLANREI